MSYTYQEAKEEEGEFPTLWTSVKITGGENERT